MYFLFIIFLARFQLHIRGVIIALMSTAFLGIGSIRRTIVESARELAVRSQFGVRLVVTWKILEARHFCHGDQERLGEP